MRIDLPEHAPHQANIMCWKGSALQGYVIVDISDLRAKRDNLTTSVTIDGSCSSRGLNCTAARVTGLLM